MKNVLVLFYTPSDVLDVDETTTDDEIKEWCFRVRKYPTPTHALMAYADTCCIWSTLKDEDDDIKAFIDEAWMHIKAHNVEWLERNFT